MYTDTGCLGFKQASYLLRYQSNNRQGRGEICLDQNANIVKPVDLHPFYCII